MVKYYDRNGKEVHYGEQLSVDGHLGNLWWRFSCIINNETLPKLIKDGWIVQKEVKEEKEPNWDRLRKNYEQGMINAQLNEIYKLLVKKTKDDESFLEALKGLAVFQDKLHEDIKALTKKVDRLSHMYHGKREQKGS